MQRMGDERMTSRIYGGEVKRKERAWQTRLGGGDVEIGENGDAFVMAILLRGESGKMIDIGLLPESTGFTPDDNKLSMNKLKS